MHRAALAVVLTTLAGVPVINAADVPTGAGARPASASALDLKGEKTTLKTAADKAFGAYLVGPKEASRGVLVIPASVGLSDAARKAAHQFAALGYRAVAIDISDGRVIADPGKARAHIQKLDQNDANAKYRAALEALREPGRRLAVVGWCFGAGQALEASLAAPDLLAATVLQGAAPAVDGARLAHLKAPVLLIPANEVEKRSHEFQTTMQRANASLEVKKSDQPIDCADSTATPIPTETREFLNRYLK